LTFRAEVGDVGFASNSYAAHPVGGAAAAAPLWLRLGPFGARVGFPDLYQAAEWLTLAGIHKSPAK